MTSVVLIPWAETDWSLAGRLNARTPLPLNKLGRKRAIHWANDLASRELAAIYRGEEKPAVQTAALLAARAEVRASRSPQLNEVDVGLWEGLTELQIRQRFPRVFKQWEEHPDSICPPDGEALAGAASRLHDAISRIAHRHRNRAVGVVLGPLSMALARCRLENRDFGEMRVMASREPVWYELDPHHRHATA